MKLKKLDIEALLIVLMTIAIALLVATMISGCTMQFKAKEIALEGHSNTTYEFTGFAWTEPEPTPQGPTD